MDTPNSSFSTIREQRPENIQFAIEQAVINLANYEMQLQNYLEFRQGGNLFLSFEPFISVFRFVVGLTGALQDVNPTDPVVSRVLTYVSPAPHGIWSAARSEAAENRAREGLALAQEYRQYLGSKGIISISR